MNFCSLLLQVIGAARVMVRVFGRFAV